MNMKKSTEKLTTKENQGQEKNKEKSVFAEAD